MERAITFDGVTKRFGRAQAVRNLTFSVEQGEMFGLIGPDGAGKSTVIRLLCGLVPSDGGRIGVWGLDPVRDHAALTRSVGYFSQRFSLYGDLSIDENVAFFAEIHGVRDYAARRDRLLDLTQLAPYRSRLAAHLSGGMKQKLALACTLVHEPRLVVLDEPTTGVDPISRRELWKLLSEFLAEGITIVISTPYLDEAERCSRVALLHEGRLLALDTPGALRATHPGGLYEVAAPDHNRACAVLRSLPWVESVQLFGERVHARVTGVAHRRVADSADAPVSASAVAGTPDPGSERLAAAFAAAAVQIDGVRPIPASLEDVFIDRLTEVAS